MKDVVKKLIDESGWPDDFEFDFNVNRWGSCQYSSALMFHDFYLHLNNMCGGGKVLWELLGITVEFKKIMTFDDIENAFIEHMKEKYESMVRDAYWTDKRIRDRIMMSRRCTSFQDMFFYGRNVASDLWNTAPMVAGFAFKDLKIEGLPKSKGIGPVCNVKVQSGNYTTGLCCALLRSHNLVTDEAFRHFDT